MRGITRVATCAFVVFASWPLVAQAPSQDRRRRNSSASWPWD